MAQKNKERNSTELAAPVLLLTVLRHLVVVGNVVPLQEAGDNEARMPFGSLVHAVGEEPGLGVHVVQQLRRGQKKQDSRAQTGHRHLLGSLLLLVVQRMQSEVTPVKRFHLFASHVPQARPSAVSI